MKKYILAILASLLLSFIYADWSQEETTGDIPSARYGHTIVNIDGKLYLFGGTDSSRALLNGFYKFVPGLNQWTKLNPANSPSGREGHSAVVYNHKMYILCGKDNTGELNDVWEYDPASNKCTQISSGSLFPSRTEQGAVNANGKIYVFGGQTNNGANILYDMWYFYIATNIWQKVGDYPSKGRYGHSIFYEQNIYINGGKSSGGLQSDTWSYNTYLDKWTPYNSDPYPPARVNQITVYDFGKATIIGGTGKSGDQKDVWEFNISTGLWKRCNDGPSITKGSGALLQSRYSRTQNIFLFGGRQNGSPVQEAWKFVDDDNENDDSNDVDNDDIFGCSTYPGKKNCRFEDLIPIVCLLLFFYRNNRNINKNVT